MAVFLIEAHSTPKNSSLCSFLIHISLFFLGMRQASGCQGAGVGAGKRSALTPPPPKISLPRAKKCSAPFKTPHQHRSRECSRQHSLVSHSVNCMCSTKCTCCVFRTRLRQKQTMHGMGDISGSFWMELQLNFWFRMLINLL